MEKELCAYIPPDLKKFKREDGFKQMIYVCDKKIVDPKEETPELLFKIKDWYIFETKKHLKRILLDIDNLGISKKDIKKFRLCDFYVSVTKSILAEFFSEREKFDFFSQTPQTVEMHIREILPDHISKIWISYLNWQRCDLGQEHPYMDYVDSVMKQNYSLLNIDKVLNATQQETDFLFLYPNMPFKQKLYHIINSKVYLINESKELSRNVSDASFSHLRLYLMKEIKKYRIEMIMKI